MTSDAPQTPPPSEMGPSQIGPAARLFRTLGEASRLRILQTLLREGPQTVTEIVKATGIAQANVSKQLTLLHDARLVARSRHGHFISYAICEPILHDLCHLVCGKLSRDARETLAALERDRRGRRP